MMKVIIALLLLLFSVPNPVLGQGSVPQASTPQAAKKAPKSMSGKLTGFAFLVTKGGDLKPARLATVTLLYWQKVHWPKEGSHVPTSMGGEYNDQWVASMNIMHDMLVQGKVPSCEDQLEGDWLALKSSLEWGTEHGHLDQVKTADADEEGHFTISGLPEGRYTLIVSGQAGANSAFWENNDVFLTVGQTTSVKLSSPKHACLAQ